MQKIGNLLRPTKPLPSHVSERGDLLKYFWENVNYERNGVTYPKLPIGAIAAKLKGLTLQDLYFLKSLCDQERVRGKSWAVTWWSALKTKPTDA